MTLLSTYPYYRDAEGWQTFWYPACLSTQIVSKTPRASQVLSVPLVLWRDSQGRARAFLDVCPHRQAPLSCGHLEGENISCPYHGWTFGIEGQCLRIPASGPSEKPKAKLRPFETWESGGLVWVWMGEGRASTPPAELAGKAPEDGWKTVFHHISFSVAVEDLIENFMDGPHTAHVHSGVIRQATKAQAREVLVSGDSKGIRVEHEPSLETLPLLRLIGKKGPVEIRHTDTFLAPSSVKVDYWLGEEEPSFSALIAMSPNGTSDTEVFLSLALRLGILNKPAAYFLPFLAKRILKQDADILALQKQNLMAMEARSMSSVASDYPDIQVRKLRKHLKTSPEKPFLMKSKEFTLYL